MFELLNLLIPVWSHSHLAKKLIFIFFGVGDRSQVLPQTDLTFYNRLPHRLPMGNNSGLKLNGTDFFEMENCTHIPSCQIKVLNLLERANLDLYICQGSGSINLICIFFSLRGNTITKHSTNLKFLEIHTNVIDFRHLISY